MAEIFTIALIWSTIRLSTPLVLAALGGLFSERSGVINIALEGMMLAGAFTAAVVTYEVQNPYIGFFCGLVAGAALATASVFAPAAAAICACAASAAFSMADMLAPPVEEPFDTALRRPDCTVLFSACVALVVRR